MTDGASGRQHPEIRFGRHRIVLGPRIWLGLGLAAVIVVIGIATGGPAGWAVGVSGVLGAILGAMFQASPVPRDWTPEATSAVRGLVNVVRDIENAQTQTTELASLQGEEQRVRLGLVDIQTRLLQVRGDVYMSVSEWERIAPGALREYERLRDAGRSALTRLSKELEEDER